MANYQSLILICLIALVLLPAPTAAFGAGNIASISNIEGHNWRHGDIEDMLKTVAFLRGTPTSTPSTPTPSSHLLCMLTSCL